MCVTIYIIFMLVVVEIVSFTCYHHVIIFVLKKVPENTHSFSMYNYIHKFM
jgi:hypothetical protein